MSIVMFHTTQLRNITFFIVDHVAVIVFTVGIVDLAKGLFMLGWLRDAGEFPPFDKAPSMTIEELWRMSKQARALVRAKPGVKKTMLAPTPRAALIGAAEGFVGFTKDQTSTVRRESYIRSLNDKLTPGVKREGCLWPQHRSSGKVPEGG